MSHFGYLWKVVHKHKRAGRSGRGPKCGVRSESLCSKGDLVGSPVPVLSPVGAVARTAKATPGESQVKMLIYRAATWGRFL